MNKIFAYFFIFKLLKFCQLEINFKYIKFSCEQIYITINSSNYIFYANYIWFDAILRVNFDNY